MQARAIRWILTVAVIAASLGFVYWKGGGKAREEVRETRAELKATEKSTRISNHTQKRVNNEGVRTQKTRDDRTGKVQSIIDSHPDGAAQPDADILRIAQEAHDSALRASCRVLGKDVCTGTTPAP